MITGQVWCMECKKFGCNVTVGMRTGWAVINNDKYNAGFHPMAAEDGTGGTEGLDVQMGAAADKSAAAAQIGSLIGK